MSHRPLSLDLQDNTGHLSGRSARDVVGKDVVMHLRDSLGHHSLMAKNFDEHLLHNELQKKKRPVRV